MPNETDVKMIVNESKGKAKFHFLRTSLFWHLHVKAKKPKAKKNVFFKA